MTWFKHYSQVKLCEWTLWSRNIGYTLWNYRRNVCYSMLGCMEVMFMA